MKVVIFGGAGEVGSSLARCLLDNTDAYVTVVDDLSMGSMSNLNYLHSNPRFEFFLGDVSDLSIVELMIAEATHIINCVNTDNIDLLVSSVIVGTQNILECLCPEQRYIHICEQAFDPNTLYETCHYASEHLVISYNNERRYRSEIVYVNQGEFLNEMVLEIISGKH